MGLELREQWISNWHGVGVYGSDYSFEEPVVLSNTICETWQCFSFAFLFLLFLIPLK